MQSSAGNRKAIISPVAPSPREGASLSRRHTLYPASLLLSLFALCALLYYFGELVDYAGQHEVERAQAEDGEDV